MVRSGQPVVVSFVGNCIEQGVGIAAGASFVDLTRDEVRRRVPEASVEFRFEPLIHHSLLDEAVDECLAYPSDILVLGMASNPVIYPTQVSTLYTNAYKPMMAVHAAKTAIERRLAADSALSRAFGGLTSIRKLFWTRKPPISVEDYRAVMAAGIRKAKAARARVIVRGPTGVEVLTEGADNKGISQVVAQVAEECDVPYLLGEELIRHRAQDYVIGNDSGRLNEAGHRIVADDLASLVVTELREVIAERAQGAGGVLAVPRPKKGPLLS
jgi:hypothetical protein